MLVNSINLQSQCYKSQKTCCVSMCRLKRCWQPRRRHSWFNGLFPRDPFLKGTVYLVNLTFNKRDSAKAPRMTTENEQKRQIKRRMPLNLMSSSTAVEQVSVEDLYWESWGTGRLNPWNRSRDKAWTWAWEIKISLLGHVRSCVANSWFWAKKWDHV